MSLYNSYGYRFSLKLYGITKDPETQEFIMIIQFADQGNLRHNLSSNFNNFLWKEKIGMLSCLAMDLKNLHKLGYFHKDFHVEICYEIVMVYLMFRILDYLGHQMNKNQMIKYVEYYHILLQKF